MPRDWQLNTMVIGLQGRPMSVAAPADGQVVTWNNTDETWEPQPTSIPNTVLNYRGAVADTASLPLTNAQTGDTYFVTGADTFYMFNGTAYVPLSVPLNSLPFPEAPTDGQIYGRNGATTSWVSVLPLAGGTLTGGLVLNGPPTPTGDPNQAASRGYVDSLVQSNGQQILRQASQFLGLINALSGTVSYTPQSGQTSGSLLPPNQVPGAFVICSVAGTLTQGALAGTQLLVGDWLISDGVNWLPLLVQGRGSGGGVGGTINAVNVVVTPPVGGWSNGQTAIEGLYNTTQNLQNQINTINGTITTIQTQISGLAPINNPSFTGNPQAPNPPLGDNDQSIATTSWVNTAIANYVSQWAVANGVLTDVTTSGDVTSV